MKQRNFINTNGMKTYMVTFPIGTRLDEAILNFAIKNQIGFAKITAIGALKDVTLGYFNKDKNGYDFTLLKENVELVSFSGTLAWDFDNKEQPMFHIHTSVAKNNYEILGGHFKSGIVTVVCELFFEQMSKDKVYRKTDEQLKIKLLDL